VTPLLGVHAALDGLTFRVAGPHGLAPALGLFVYYMFFTNWFWSIFNLLPILPLDGGNVMAHALAAATGGGGRRIAHIVSIAVAILMVAWLLLSGRGGILGANWLGLFALQNFRALQPASPGPPPAKQRW
jgi:Zn-dependent protease